MKDLKHTKGPWELMGSVSTSNQTNIYADENKVVASVAGYEFYKCTIEEAQANANLIAAAPDLLDACITLINEYESKGQLLGLDVNIFREAIKKSHRIT